MIKAINICFATNNEHKLKEVRHILMPDFCVLSLSEIGCIDELPETGTTLEENARQKTAYIFEKYNTPCFSDDTGLEVDALKGAPGVYSARYAGMQRNDRDNINLLLANLGTSKNRQAQFRTAICWMSEKETQFFEGIVKGHITHTPAGNEGFGYDAVFIPDGFDKTFAQMTLEQKNKYSHRTRATEKLVHYLKTRWQIIA